MGSDGLHPSVIKTSFLVPKKRTRRHEKDVSNDTLPLVATTSRNGITCNHSNAEFPGQSCEKQDHCISSSDESSSSDSEKTLHDLIGRFGKYRRSYLDQKQLCDYYAQKMEETGKRIDSLLKNKVGRTFDSRDDIAQSEKDSIVSTPVVYGSRRSSSTRNSDGNIKLPLTFRTEYHLKAFHRKPRSLVFLNNESFITSSLDGKLTIWDLSRKSAVQSFQLPRTWADSLVYDHHNGHVIVAYGGPIEGDQIQIFDVKNAAITLKNSRVNMPRPHSKNISSLMTMAQSIVTGGDDREIYEWDISCHTRDSNMAPRARLIHREHTSSVQALSHSESRHNIYSGGADCKFICWSMARSKKTRELKMAGRVSNILNNPVKPDVFLCSLSTKNDQLNLLDQRCDRVTQKFGWEETENLSRYITPAWHPDGNLIACGSVSSPAINLWDTRFPSKSPIQSHQCHEKRIAKVLWHPRDNCIVSLSSDNAIGFSSF